MANLGGNRLQICGVGCQPRTVSLSPPNKQLQRTVTRRRGRAARAPFHYARAPRFKRQRAAAELRRYTARTAYRSGNVEVRFRHVSDVRRKPLTLCRAPDSHYSTFGITGAV